MEEWNVSADDQEALVEELRRAYRAAPLAQGADPADALSADRMSIHAVETFCAAWPAAKEALALLVPVLERIPALRMMARSSIGVVVLAGDAAQLALCGGPATGA